MSFTYNSGIGALKASTLLKQMNAGAFVAVPAEPMKWMKAKGKEFPYLVRRRHAPIKCFAPPLCSQASRSDCEDRAC